MSKARVARNLRPSNMYREDYATFSPRKNTDPGDERMSAKLSFRGYCLLLLVSPFATGSVEVEIIRATPTSQPEL